MSSVSEGVAAFWASIQTLEDLRRVIEEKDRYKAALEVIYGMPDDSIWADDRDDAADLMWEAAREALFPTPPKKRKKR